MLLTFGKHGEINDAKAKVECLLFTIATSILVGSVAAKTDPWKVLMCAGFTLGDCLAIAAFLQSKKGKKVLNSAVNCQQTFFVVGFVAAVALIFYMV